eukprot:10202056-Ditylum_brightwellii.AAC.1
MRERKERTEETRESTNNDVDEDEKKKIVMSALHNSIWLFAMNFYSTDDSSWDGGGLSWTLLSFAIITPMSSSIGMAFGRREAALRAIAALRSTAYNIYSAHAIWDWRGPSHTSAKPTGRDARTNFSSLHHSDQVLTTLIDMGQELAQILTLPCITRARHR